VTTTTEFSISKKQKSAAAMLGWFFCAWVIALVFFNFSENTADPDLWGHALFGQEMLVSHHLDKVEPYSWTANHGPWINHEVLAEVALGEAHFLLGGTGIWLLTVVVGLATFAIALRLALQNLTGAARAFAWATGALAVVEIAFGFAARPQIFTAFALAILLWLLRKIDTGKILWAIALPILFLLWINTHGGALAGIVLLFGACGANTLQFLWSKRSANSRETSGSRTSALGPRLLIALWIACAISIAALFCNPYGAELVKWLIKSVSWYRPEIAEWNPPQLGWDHGPMFILVALAAISFLFSRRPKALWEIGICTVLAVIALRSVRHTPLFAISALAFVPPHLADVFARSRGQFERLIELFSQKSVQTLSAIVLAIAAAATFYASLTFHKERPFTMEAPRNQYPVSAVKFIRDHDLRGNMLAFFDWGEMVLWQLPECSPSIDGRLDTCYSRQLISEHWKFYNGEAFDSSVLNIDAADLALLPAKLVGAHNLSELKNWRVVYLDPLAVVMVRDSNRFPKLAGIQLPVTEPESAILGREPFPNSSSGRISARNSR
jgi:hypothetical protein